MKWGTLEAVSDQRDPGLSNRLGPWVPRAPEPVHQAGPGRPGPPVGPGGTARQGAPVAAGASAYQAAPAYQATPTQTVVRPWVPRPAPAWAPPPAVDPVADARWRKAERDLRRRRILIGAGVVLVAIALLVASVVIFKSTDRQVAQTRAAQTPTGPDPGVVPPGDTNGNILVNPSTVPLPAVVAPTVPGQPAAGTTAPPTASTTLPVSPPATLKGTGPVQPISVQKATSPAKVPPVTAPPTKAVTIQETAAAFFLPRVYPGPVTFTPSAGCSRQENGLTITVTDPGSNTRPLRTSGESVTYQATAVGQYTVSIVPFPQGCTITVTYTTRGP